MTSEPVVKFTVEQAPCGWWMVYRTGANGELIHVFYTHQALLDHITPFIMGALTPAPAPYFKPNIILTPQ